MIPLSFSPSDLLLVNCNQNLEDKEYSPNKLAPQGAEQGRERWKIHLQAMEKIHSMHLPTKSKSLYLSLLLKSLSRDDLIFSHF